MPRKYFVFYQEAKELLHLAGEEKAIEVIREGKKPFKGESETSVVKDPDFYTKKLLKMVSDLYNCSSEDLISETCREITEARKICFSIMKFVLDMQYAEIGYLFGKDGSTICRGVTSFQAIIKSNPAFRDKYEFVNKQMRVLVKK